MRIDPPKPPSSRPTACSMADLPDPEGPSKATISPSPTVRATPRNTLRVSPPWLKLRGSPVTSRMGLFIAQHLHRIGARRLVGRVERGEEARDQRDDGNDDDLDRIGLRGQLVEETERRIP